MISIYKSTEKGLESIEEIVNGCWINLTDPTPAEIEKVTALGIPQDFITYPLDVDERARTEREDDGKILIVIKVPMYVGPTVDVPYTTIPLGFVITDTVLVTVCRHSHEIIQEFASGRVRGLSTAKRNRFILKVLLSTANKYLAYLRDINRTVDALEDKAQKAMRNKEVYELLKFQKSLVYFTTALKSNELVFERLHRTQLFRMYPDDEDLLEDVITENQQAIEVVNISNNILSSMMDAFASIISNNLNVVMKFLASITIVMSIPTIVTSFFGMNVDLPFDGFPFAWLIVIGISVGVGALVTFIFMKRDWF
ncbi:Mg2+ and Co2+ transporters [Longilinea arvoryzae]|uniref:Mg2+ and Co2+ transporters n=1 Tax=Longilinea arvoryzae TaxID=360412 RepID=A0A0S7BFZ3_9CHLR|nr:magnesium transporter CorA family protein [Longilinea arvoryzae]GAP14493.1 Mg2+ and Co2+ transporters [Longilinea arvoryzae]